MPIMRRVDHPGGPAGAYIHWGQLSPGVLRVNKLRVLRSYFSSVNIAAEAPGREVC